MGVSMGISAAFSICFCVDTSNAWWGSGIMHREEGACCNKPDRIGFFCLDSKHSVSMCYEIT